MQCIAETTPAGFGSDGTWGREARRVSLLAGELGIALDQETLILYDVRELMALRLRLQRALGRRRVRVAVQ